jgi:hypothetical protein
VGEISPAKITPLARRQANAPLGARAKKSFRPSFAPGTGTAVSPMTQKFFNVFIDFCARLFIMRWFESH